MSLILFCSDVYLYRIWICGPDERTQVITKKICNASWPLVFFLSYATCTDRKTKYGWKHWYVKFRSKADLFSNFNLPNEFSVKKLFEVKTWTAVTSQVCRRKHALIIKPFTNFPKSMWQRKTLRFTVGLMVHIVAKQNGCKHFKLYSYYVVLVMHPRFWFSIYLSHEWATDCFCIFKTCTMIPWSNEFSQVLLWCDVHGAFIEFCTAY